MSVMKITIRTMWITRPQWFLHCREVDSSAVLGSDRIEEQRVSQRLSGRGICRELRIEWPTSSDW